MRKFEPDLAKNLNKEVRAALTPVQKKAQSYVPSTIPGLSNWMMKTKAKTEGATNSKGFPKFNSNLVRRGIKIYLGKTSKNNRGFVTYYRIANTTAPGAIMETSGRVHPSGQPWVGKKGNLGAGSGGKTQLNHHYSHSNDPQAGLHFINSLGSMRGGGKTRGRLIYRAWDEDQGNALRNVRFALDKTIQQFHNRADAQIFRTLS
jgi:hypothetical protein